MAEFEAAPWLLPPRCDALPYAGVRDLDRLLQLRAVAAGGHPKTITLIPYSLLFVDMLQNASEQAPPVAPAVPLAAPAADVGCLEANWCQARKGCFFDVCDRAAVLFWPHPPTHPPTT